MSVLQNWTEILESLGTGASEIYKKTSPFTQLNEPILSALCNIWAKYPKGVLLNPYARGFGRGMCSAGGKPTPPIPVPPFPGGQCLGSFYDVLIYSRRNDQSGSPQDYLTTIPNRRGPINDIGLTLVPGTPARWYFYIDYTPLTGANPYLYIAPGWVDTKPRITNIVLNPVNNSPDNCGSKPPQYPDDPPRDPVDFTKNYTFNIYNQAGDVINKISGDIKFDMGDDFTFPITIDVGGIEVIVDYDGISTPNPAPKPKPRPPGGKGDYTPVPEPDKDSDKKTFTDSLEYVELKVSQKPVNAKSQWGSGAPNVYYCGWFEFSINNKNLPRQPIHFVDNVFIAPDNANGYAYTLYQGFQGTATAYIKREIVPPQGLPQILPA